MGNRKVTATKPLFEHHTANMTNTFQATQQNTACFSKQFTVKNRGYRFDSYFIPRGKTLNWKSKQKASPIMSLNGFSNKYSKSIGDIKSHSENLRMISAITKETLRWAFKSPLCLTA